MRRGKYVVKSVRVNDGSEVDVPQKAQEVKLTGNDQLSVAWLERVASKDNQKIDVVDSIGTVALFVGVCVLFWMSSLLIFGVIRL